MYDDAEESLKREVDALRAEVARLKGEVLYYWQNPPTQLKYEYMTKENERLRGLCQRIWIQCEREGKPVMCWDSYHELERINRERKEG